VFRKILIANRGEIALRVIRACAEMDIRTATIYTEPDRYSLHVKRADETYHVGDDPVAGYLNPHRIVNLAVAASCDAIHPGYGFLSENAELAEICARRGVKFIGPPAPVMRAMGDKTQARRTMQAAGVPVTPGSEGDVADVEQALIEAERVGYPVMLKASGGGGGRGIRRCEDANALALAWPRVVSEAASAFGSAGVFVEKCIENPRHIEVQVLADERGEVVHLFERDCSLQRRNQKLVEIAPSPRLDRRLRRRVCDLAVRAAKAAGYRNAGTVEFLLDEDELYFMEMNTRIQVEHTITEMITGIDIVREQIRIAAGERLSARQKDIAMRGYAIQFRINAEDPRDDFLPSFGHVTHYYAPGGPGVRTDTAIYTGYSIPPHFDSLLLKVVVWALTWEEAIARGRRALDDMRLRGVKTTARFYQHILRDPEFRRGEFDTGFLGRRGDLTRYSERDRAEETALAIATAIAAQSGI
jgi:pyruvate carboxylase subunit A